MPPLTDSAIRAAKPAGKPFKIYDELGLYLLVKPNGARLWRFKYSVAGKEKLLSFGDYRDVSLKRAREKRAEARRLVADDIDPSAARQARKASAANTFEVLGKEWLAQQAKVLEADTVAEIRKRLELHLFPPLGSKPIDRIEAPDLLAALRKIESRGKHHTAHRAKSAASRIFRYAIATGRARRDPTADLRGALVPSVAKHHPSLIDPARVGELLRAIGGYQGQMTTACALRLAPLTFVRPSELRKAEWAEFALEGKEPTWRIPAARMKMRDPHIVPLSTQAVAVLKDLQPLTGDGALVFPSLRSAARPISENTVNAALRRLGYGHEEMTGHGFRSMASTLLNEQGWHPDLIELQLAHKERNTTRAAYNKAQRLTERRKMMQAWADYLDGLRAGAKVAPIRDTASRLHKSLTDSKSTT